MAVINTISTGGDTYYILSGIRGIISTSAASTSKTMTLLQGASTSTTSIGTLNTVPSYFMIPVYLSAGNTAATEISLTVTETGKTYKGKIPKISTDNAYSYNGFLFMFDGVNNKFRAVDLLGSNSWNYGCETGAGNTSSTITVSQLVSACESFPKQIITMHLLACPTEKPGARSSGTVLTDQYIYLRNCLSGVSSSSIIYRIFDTCYYPICPIDMRAQDPKFQLRSIYMTSAIAGRAGFTLAPANPTNTTADGTDQNLTCRILWEKFK